MDNEVNSIVTVTYNDNAIGLNNSNVIKSISRRFLEDRAHWECEDLGYKCVVKWVTEGLDLEVSGAIPEEDLSSISEEIRIALDEGDLIVVASPPSRNRFEIALGQDDAHHAPLVVIDSKDNRSEFEFGKSDLAKLNTYVASLTKEQIFEACAQQLLKSWIKAVNNAPHGWPSHPATLKTDLG